MSSWIGRTGISFTLTLKEDRCSSFFLSFELLRVMKKLMLERANRWYVKPRCMLWFTNFLMDEYPPDLFFDLLHCKKKTFTNLYNVLRGSLQKQNTNRRMTISVEKRVACTLFKLMSESKVKLVSHVFGIVRSTVQEILREFVEAMNHNLSYMVDWPNLRALREIAKEFEAMQGLPNCLGTLDGTQIPIAPPPFKSRQEDCKNRKGQNSIVIQAIVDADCCFTYLHVGLPG